VEILFITLSVTVLATAIGQGALRWPGGWGVPGIAASIAAILVIAGALLTVITRSRLGAITALGASGLGVSFIFLIGGAPDVATTQLLIDTLFVILIAAAAMWLPGLSRRSSQSTRARVGAGVIATVVGVTVTGVLLAVLDQPLDRSITTYFEQTAVPDAHGRNIVNVILVDFRALDTFGEIAVVAIAALAGFALIRKSWPAKLEGEAKATASADPTAGVGAAPETGTAAVPPRSENRQSQNSQFQNSPAHNGPSVNSPSAKGQDPA
jgi:multicomponent Na+:H+ antiporter subunit A